MRENILLHCLTNNKSYQLLQQLINVFYGFDLSLLALDGQFIEPSDKTATASLKRFSRDSQVSFAKRFSNKHLLEEIQGSRQSRIVNFGQNGRKQLFVPVVPTKDVVGFVFVSEDGDVHLTEAESQITLDFLTDYVRLLVKTDMEFVEYFQNKDMTHQQSVVHDVVRYVQENYHVRQLTLKDVSDWRGISYHYLSSLFKKEMHMGFKSYLNQVRLDKAIQLLQSRRLPISQIAYQCGFEDPAYFSKCFKQEIGISPSDCRDHPVPLKIKRRNVLEVALSA